MRQEFHDPPPGDTHDPLDRHHTPDGLSDRIAFGLTKLLRFIAYSFFAKRYGHRAVVLETVAGVPGMVGGMVRHMRSLRRLEHDRGWIHTLLAEAENERMHLMTFIEIARPNLLERAIILVTQGIFFTIFVILYVVSVRNPHLLVCYLDV